jgi:membrane-associated phospholipid phosphatase
MCATLAMAVLALVISLTTGLGYAALPIIAPLVLSVLVLDILCQLAPQTRIVAGVHMIIHGVLYLAVTSYCGVLAAYALQRLDFPLQDHLFAIADRALGIEWFPFVHWVDGSAALHTILMYAYRTISFQIALPLLVLSFANRMGELRVYLLSYGVALLVTVLIAAFVPANSPIALVDRASFAHMEFTGATPLEHLHLLRNAGPIVIAGAPAGIITFPSFHATVALLTPIVLRQYRGLLVALLVLDAAMLVGTVTEGAHYAVDVLAGGVIALGAYLFALNVLGGDRVEYASRPSNLGAASPLPSPLP